MDPTEATGVDRGGSGRSSLMVQRPLTFNPPAQAGFTPASCNRSTLLQYVTASLSDDAVQDEDYHKLESFYLNSGFGYHVSSLVMKAQELAISHEVLQKKLWHMAAAQWINQKQQRHALEQRICLQLGPQQQVAYVDCASYHETPMKSTVEQPPIMKHADPQITHNHHPAHKTSR